MKGSILNLTPLTYLLLVIGAGAFLSGGMLLLSDLGYHIGSDIIVDLVLFGSPLVLNILLTALLKIKPMSVRRFIVFISCFLVGLILSHLDLGTWAVSASMIVYVVLYAVALNMTWTIKTPKFYVSKYILLPLCLALLLAIATVIAVVFSDQWSDYYHHSALVAIIFTFNIIFNSLYSSRGAKLKVLTGSHSGMVYYVDKEVYNVGSSFSDDICLSDYYGINPSHFKIVQYKYPKSYVLINNSLESALQLNYRRCEQQVLEDEDIISVGKVLMQFYY